MGALDHGERHHAKRRQDVVLERAPVDAGGMRVAVLGHVGAHVALGEVGDGGAAPGRRHGRLLAPLDAVDDLGRAEPRLRRGDLAVGAEGDAARAAAGAALDDVDLPARGVDAHAEAGELPVPEDDVAVCGAERVHRAAGERERATARHSRHHSAWARAQSAKPPSSLRNGSKSRATTRVRMPAGKAGWSAERGVQKRS